MYEDARPPEKILAARGENPAIATQPQEYPVGREDSMLDVHLPHGKLHDVKEFFLHLFTITIGLLIALGLEGWVEFEHHRHLAHQAEDGLRAEIAHNSQQIGHRRQQIKDAQEQLKADLKVLAALRTHPRAKSANMSFATGMEGFDDVSWKNAQNTGVLAYMRYEDAQAFSDIYAEQDECLRMVRLQVEEITNSASLFIAHPDDWVPSPAQIDVETDRIGRAQIQLIWLGSVVDQLDKTYQKFESGHK
jgi:hypothetical protein